MGRSPGTSGAASELPGKPHAGALAQYEQSRQRVHFEQLIASGFWFWDSRVVGEEQPVGCGGDEAANARADERPFVGRFTAARV